MRREVAIAGHNLIKSSDDSQSGASAYNGHGEVSTVDENHPESTSRLRAALAGITVRGLWPLLRQLPKRTASDTELELCHTRDHLRALQRATDLAAKRGKPLFLPVHGRFSSTLAVEKQLTSSWQPGRDTFVTGGSLKTARRAAGGLLSIVDAIFSPSSVRRGFCLARPPGHHAGRDSSDGFCLVNNLAVAANYARRIHSEKVKRVLIFDWDVHHGQGTQDIFWSDPDVLVVSVHRREAGFYPQSGDAAETGEGSGRGFTINVPLEAGYSDACLWLACSEVLLPAARRFQPDLILVSAGVDAVEGDPLGGCMLTSKCLGQITSELCALAEELCDGRLVLSLEGGYSEEVLRDSVGEIFDALLMPEARKNGGPTAAAATTAAPPFSEPPKSLLKRPPLASSRSSIQAVRLAHRGLPLRLSEGYASKLQPFPAKMSLAVEASSSSKRRNRKRDLCLDAADDEDVEEDCDVNVGAAVPGSSRSSRGIVRSKTADFGLRAEAGAFPNSEKSQRSQASRLEIPGPRASKLAKVSTFTSSSASSSSASCSSIQHRSYRRLVPTTGQRATTLLLSSTSEVSSASSSSVSSSSSSSVFTEPPHPPLKLIVCLSKNLWRALSVKDQSMLSTLNVRLSRTVTPGVHFVVATTLRRTETLMCCICRGIPILTSEWLMRCLEAQKILPVEGYELKDQEAEQTLGITLSEALSRARRRPLLRGYEVFLAASIAGERRRVAAQVVEAAGGTLLPNSHEPKHHHGQLLLYIDVEADDDPSDQQGARQRQSEKATFPRFALELLFQGALKQELRLDSHRLSSSRPLSCP